MKITERLLAGILPHLDPASGLPRLDGVAGDRGRANRYALGQTVGNSRRWSA